jgi:hypothetical protein
MISHPLLKELLHRKVDTEERNVPFTAQEIRETREYYKGGRFVLKNDFENRSSKRSEEHSEGKPTGPANCRPVTKARKAQRLYIKMSRFFLSIGDKRRNLATVIPHEQKLQLGISNNTLPRHLRKPYP